MSEVIDSSGPRKIIDASSNAKIKARFKKRKNVKKSFSSSLKIQALSFSRFARRFLSLIDKYIDFKKFIRRAFYGVMSFIAISIVSFKTYQIHYYKSFNTSVLEARTSYNEMYLLCRNNNNLLNKEQKEEFNSYKQKFNQNKEDVLKSDLYVFKDVLFYKEISIQQTEISDDLMDVGSILTSCKSLKKDTIELQIKQKRVKAAMLRSLFSRWIPLPQ